MKQILVIEDDKELRDQLADQLVLHEEIEVEGVGTGAAALERVKAKPFNMILLDVGLPDMDGREVCRKLRRAGVRIPIVMLTGADTEADTILGLDSGANDYVTKPFKFGVLLARIRAHLRQHEQSEDAIFQIGPYTFKPALKLLVHNTTASKTRLTEKETLILKHLLRAKGASVGRSELLTKVWGYNAGVTTHTLETHIYRLRQKIEENPNAARLILTDGGGYKLEPAEMRPA